MLVSKKKATENTESSLAFAENNLKKVLVSDINNLIYLTFDIMDVYLY